MVTKNNSYVLSAIAVCLILFSFHPCFSYAQGQVQKRDQRTLLQLGSGFVAVVTHGQILLDSGLIISANANHLSRISIITEGFKDQYPQPNYQWMDNNHVDSVKKKLSRIKSFERVRQLLSLGAYFAFKPGSKNNYKEAIKFLTRAKEEAEILHLFRWSVQSSCLIGKSYFMLENIAAGKIWFTRAIEEAKSFKYLDIEAKIWNYQGIYCPFRGETNQFRITCLKQALSCYRNLNDDGNQINTLMDLAYISFANQQTGLSEFYAKQSVSLQISKKFPYQQYSYDLLAFLANINGKDYTSYNYAYDELLSVQKTKDDLIMNFAYYRIGIAKFRINRSDEGVTWLIKALKTKQFFECSYLYAILPGIIEMNLGTKRSQELLPLIQKTIKAYPPRNITNWIFVNLSIGSCYEVLGKYDTAINYFLKAKNMYHGTIQGKGEILQPTIFYDLGFAYFLKKDYKNSRNYFLRLTADSFKFTRSKDQLSDAYFKLYQIDSIYNYTSSRNWLLSYANLQNEIFDESESKQIADMNVKYETLQKEKNIQALKNQNMLQRQQEMNTKRLFYMGLLALAIIATVVYSRFRNNQRKNSLLKIQKDEISHKNITLQNMNDKQTNLLIEKEWLLKEVHHRVKNNLQIVTSLLTSQSVFLKDQAALNAITESQHRIEAMSLIHQKLYNSENMSTIYMPDYITDLVVYLKDSYHVKGLIRVNFQIDKIKLDVAKAIPLGLILNEAITNAFKYAFPNTIEDTVSVKLNSLKNKSILLVVSDNGRGFPENFDFETTKTFGIILMKGMAEELDGTFKISNRNGGTKVSLTFPNYPVLVS